MFAQRVQGWKAWAGHVEVQSRHVMGLLIYDRCDPIEMEDRTLAHLQVVIVDKLRRGEHFAMTLQDGRRLLTCWLSPRTPLQFIYHGNRQPALNHAWLELLAGEAGVSGILTLLPEPHVPVRQEHPHLV